MKGGWDGLFIALFTITKGKKRERREDEMFYHRYFQSQLMSNIIAT
jgi:hypothetical protein